MVDIEKKFGSAGHLKPGSFVLIDGDVCQVKSLEKSKPGKHGAAKARVTAISIFTDQKKTILKPADADVEIPIIRRSTAQVVAVMGGNVQVMDTSNYETYDVANPKEFSGLQSGDEVEYIQFGDSIRIVRKK